MLAMTCKRPPHCWHVSISIASTRLRRCAHDIARCQSLTDTSELLATGAEGNYIDYVSAEQAFRAVQMLVLEIGDSDLQARLDAIGDALSDDERYSPARFRTLLAQPGE